MSYFDEWSRRHLAADPQEPASPPRPDEDAAIPYTVSITEPNTIQVGPDREQLRDHEPFMSSVSAAAREIEQRFSQSVEDSLAEWTAKHEGES